VLGFAGFLFLTTGLPILLSRQAASQQKAFHFTDVTIDATVLADGGLRLEERRTVEFRGGPFSFARFDVDEPTDHVRDFTVTQVGAGGEQPVVALTDPVADRFSSTFFYDANDETTTFVFRYRVACAVRVYTDAAHLEWQFIGTGWTEPTDTATVTVHLPGRAPERAVRRPATCDPAAESVASVPGSSPLAAGDTLAWGHGRLNGTVEVLDPQTVRLRVTDVPPASFVEGSILFPVGAVPRAASLGVAGRDRVLADEAAFAAEANRLRLAHRRDVRLGQALFVLIPALLALAVLLARLRDRVPEVPRTLQEPPEDDPVDAALLWTAWRGSLSPIAAYRTQLLHLAQIGAVTIEAVGPVTDPEDLIARRGKEVGTERDRRFVDLLFPTAEDTVSLKKHTGRPADTSGVSPAARYRAWWRNATARGGDVVKRIQHGDARIESVAAFAVGLGSLVVAIWLAARHTGPWVWLLPPVGLIGMVLALRAIPARVDRPLRERVARLAAFRRFLRDFSDLPNAPALAVIVWEQYLVFATALGVADEVERQVSALVPPGSLAPPFPGAPTGAPAVTYWRSVTDSAPAVVLSSSASSTSFSSSSGSRFGSFSSSSGFGGGFSSGGGGGGGGTGGSFG
jgi:hypothetical protein